MVVVCLLCLARPAALKAGASALVRLVLSCQSPRVGDLCIYWAHVVGWFFLVSGGLAQVKSLGLSRLSPGYAGDKRKIGPFLMLQ